MSQPTRIPKPDDELRKEIALSEAYIDIKGLVKHTLKDDSALAVGLRSALSALYIVRNGPDLQPHQKQTILRSLVARRETTWIDLGTLNESQENDLVLKNLWILEVPAF